MATQASPESPTKKCSPERCCSPEHMHVIPAQRKGQRQSNNKNQKGERRKKAYHLKKKIILRGSLRGGGEEAVTVKMALE